MASGDGSRGRKSTLEDNQLKKRLALLEVASFVLSHRIDAVSGHVGLCHTLPALSLSSVCPMNNGQGSRGQVLPAAWPSFKCATCTSTVQSFDVSFEYSSTTNPILFFSCAWPSGTPVGHRSVISGLRTVSRTG